MKLFKCTCFFQTSMNAGTIPAVCVRTSVTTSWAPTSAAAPRASSWPATAGTVTVQKHQHQQLIITLDSQSLIH